MMKVTIYFWVLLIGMAWLQPVMAQERVVKGAILHDIPLQKSVNALLEDHDGFMWAGTSEGLYRYDGFTADQLKSSSPDSLEIGSSAVYALLEDEANNLWVGSRNGLFIFNADRSVQFHLPADLPFLSAKRNPLNLQNVEHEVWVFNYSNQVTCFSTPTDLTKAPTVIRHLDFGSNKIENVVRISPDQLLLQTSTRYIYLITDLRGNVLKSIHASKENPVFFQYGPLHQTMAIASPEFYRFDPGSGEFTLEASFQDLFLKPTPCFTEISHVDPDQIWIGNVLGYLIRYSMKSGHYLDYTTYLSNRLYEGRFFKINALKEDKSGGLWIGTNQSLVYLKVPDQQYFHILPRPSTQISKSNFSTRGMVELPDHSVFVSSYAGFYRYLPGGEIREYQTYNEEDHRWVDPVVYDFLPDGERMLVATEGNGILIYDIARDTLIRTIAAETSGPFVESGLGHAKWIFRIIKDHTGTYYAGSLNGLFTWSGGSNYSRLPDVPGAGYDMGKVSDIYEDEKGVLWLATANGLYTLSSDRKKLDKINLFSDPYIPVQVIAPDDHGRIWIGSRNKGLCVLDLATGHRDNFTVEDGLPDNTICAIRNLHDGFIWISTNNGLSRYEVARNQFANFFMEDGLPDNEFNHSSSMVDENGRLYFGGVNGVVWFEPRQTASDTTLAHLRVSKIITHDGKNGSTRENLYNDASHPVIRLGSRDKYFTIFFSTNIPTPNSREIYAYRMKGLHNDWQSNGFRNYIQFMGLSPGHYTLQIKSLTRAYGNDEQILEIPVVVERPYATRWWAFVLYVASAALILFLVLNEYFKRRQIRHRLKLEIDHKERLEDINRSKSAFFTNITHEFKTPLTLIQGPAEEIAYLSKDTAVVKKANLISKNVKSILSLVNQLLELGKLEADLETPKFYRLDLAVHLHTWLEKFSPLARQKRIGLNFSIPDSGVYVDFDPVKMETVINNLLSNALKFTPENGSVACSLTSVDQANGQKEVLITVKDTGSGIPVEEQALVFERFYQGKNSVMGGTGIGLAFVREMVRIHNGQIELTSAPGEGATFRITIPVIQEGTMALDYAAAPVEVMQENGKEITQDEIKGAKPIVLVVEDHREVAELISDVLSADYQVLHAANGRDGFEIASEEIPDLIITDVMMPIMDGLTFTHMVRQNSNTCHIPVIMLTAKDGVTSRIEGRTHGADVYLEKPFSIQELLLSVRNLILLKRRMAEKMAGQLHSNLHEATFATDSDNSFYARFLELLESHFAEQDLNVELITQRLAISRTQLHRKLKALTGLSVNTLVRNFRLQRALNLLKESTKNVSEVAYEVGFSSPSYFTERFREHFGYPPSEIHAQ